MPDLDDEGLESYLKQFRPLVPNALPVDEIRLAAPRRFLGVIWAVGAVAMLSLGLAALRTLHHRTTGATKHFASIRLVAPTPPLTVREANALLAAAPSYKAVMDDLAFHSKSSTLANDKQSALAVLGKEKIKL